MFLATMDLSAAHPVTKYSVQQDAKALVLKATYNANALTTADAAFADFKAALNGKVTVSYVRNTPSLTVTMVPNLLFSDVVEAYAGVGGLVHIDVATAVGPDGKAFTHTATVVIPFNHAGNLSLGANTVVTIEFDGFTNGKVSTVDGAVNANPVIDIETEVAVNYVAQLVVIEPVSIPDGQTTSFDLTYHSVLAIPATLNKLTIFAPTGATAEYNATGLNSWAKMRTRTHFMVNGVRSFYQDWVMMNCLNNNKAQMSLADGTYCFLMATKALA